MKRFQTNSKQLLYDAINKQTYNRKLHNTLLKTINTELS